MKTASKQNRQTEETKYVGFFFAANSCGKILKGDGRKRGGELHLERVRGELPAMLPRHGPLRLPLATPPFRFTFLLFFQSPSLWHRRTREREREGRPLPCFFGNRVAQESIKTPRSANTVTHSLLSFLLLFWWLFFFFDCADFLCHFRAG